MVRAGAARSARSLPRGGGMSERVFEVLVNRLRRRGEAW